MDGGQSCQQALTGGRNLESQAKWVKYNDLIYIFKRSFCLLMADGQLARLQDLAATPSLY